jgi:Flp pilus assembly CpaF family ATPase
MAWALRDLPCMREILFRVRSDRTGQRAAQREAATVGRAIHSKAPILDR